MDEEKFWYLLSLKLSGEATSHELEALDSLLQQYPELGLQAQLMQQMWKKNDSTENITEDFFNRHLQRLSNHPDTSPFTVEHLTIEPAPSAEISTRSNRYRIVSLSGIAAAVIVTIFFFFTYNKPISDSKKPDHAAQNTVSTRKGSKSNIELPDGTIAWLNADSKLTYDENFRGEFREVSLEGEAYFDVVKDKTRPFIIHTKTIDVRVLGTAFNVRAYETEKNTETSLFRGSVEVSLHNNPEKKIILKPNEKLMVNNKSMEFGKSNNKEEKNEGPDLSITVSKVHFQAKDSSALETLWIKNKLVFDAETLEEVAGKIERWYNVKVIINGDDDVKKTAYTAIFENETVAQVMEALKITGNLKYTINKDIITIR